MRRIAAALAIAGTVLGAGAALAENTVAEQRARLDALWGAPPAGTASQASAGKAVRYNFIPAGESAQWGADRDFGRKHEPAGR